MRKVLAALLALLMLSACGCALEEPAVEDDAYVADILDNADLITLANSANKEVRVSASQYAFVRSGKYGDMHWREINAQQGIGTNNEEPLGLKNNGTNPLFICFAT